MSSTTLLLLSSVLILPANTPALTWTKLPGVVSTQQVDALLFTQDGEIYSGSRYSGVYRSSDGGNTWTALNDGLNGSGVWSFCINADGDVLAAGRTTYSYRLPKGTATWQQSNYTAPAAYGLLKNGDIMNVKFSGGYYISKDGGQTFTHIAGTTGNPQCIGVDPLTGRVFVGTEGAGVWMSEDNGVNWTQATSTLSNGGAIGFNAQGEAFYFNPPYRWTGGTTWVPCAGIPYNHRVMAYALSKTGVLYAGTDVGILYVSVDDGRTWQPDLQFPQTGSRIISLGIDSAGYLYAGMRDSNGIYKAMESTLAVKSPDAGGVRNPVSFSPNPFNQKTIISLPLPARSGKTMNAEIGIFDARGKRVARLYTRSSAEWNAGQLPNGVYLVRATLNGQAFIKTVTLKK